MSNPPYRALRIILGIVCVFTAAAGLLLVFSGKLLVMRLFLRPPEAEISTLLLLVMRELIGRISSHAQCVDLFRVSRPGSQRGYRERTHCGSLHPGHNTVAVALYAGHSPALSRLFNLGAIADSVGTGSCAPFHAAATER